MNRKLVSLLLIVFIISAALLAKDFIVKAILEKTVENLSGLKIRFGSIDVGIFNTSIRAKDMLILNTPSFSDKVMAQINHLYMNYDITSGFRRQIHIKDMIFDVGLVNVVKNRGGENNLNSLKLVKALEKAGNGGKTNGSMPKIIIDNLHLKGGKVVYKDYTKAPYPEITEFEVRVDERYQDITDPYELVSLIVSRSLVKTSPSTIIGFDLTPLQNKVREAMSQGAQALKKLIHADKERP